MSYSIIQKSELKSGYRIDAEYYDNYYFDLEKKIKSKKYFNLREISSKSTEKFKREKDFKYLEIANVNCFNGDYFYAKIKKEDAPSRAQKVLQEKDVVISTVRPNRNAVVFIKEKSFDMPKVASSGFCVLRDFKNILPEYIYVLFKTFIIRDLLDRETTATMYPAVSENDIKDLKIPIPSDGFQKEVAKVVRKADMEREKSKELYAEAEEILLEELGLKDYKPTNENIAIVDLNEVEKCKRIDPEFFQPKYDEILEKINKFKTKTLDDLTIKYTGGFTYKSEKFQEDGVPLIRINNIKKGFLDLGNTAFLSEEYSDISKKDIARSGDILISMSGTIGNCVVIPENIKKCCVNQRILAITPKDINLTYLELFLNSIAGMLQFEKIGVGGLQTNLSTKDILNLQIPILDQKIQEKIAKKIKDSHLAREKSKELLEKAKKAVEIYIEEDEKEAQKTLKNN
ncbi:restriction endonuclease subunit S [Patescibacteria group bacterium]|nr:restriction endonuclease subunit S [Patescibacteria group bacterium]